MENKKVCFSEQLLSPRRKVVSRFGLGVVVSVVVFISVVVLSKSFAGPFTSLNFQAIQVSNSSWPFSSSTANASRFDGDGGSTLNVGENVENSSSVVEDSNALLRNLSAVQKNVSFVDDISLKLPVVKNVIKEGTINVSNLSGGNSSLTENLDGGEVGNADDGKRNVGNLLYNGGNLSFSRGKSAALKSLNNDSSITNMASDSVVECDIFDGRWVRDDSKPYYPPGSCPHIDRDFDCHSNGRPDDGYLRWKWQPNRCNMSSLNATDFLERLRGKKLVFVGDSLNRNMWESLVCILRHSVKYKKQVYEISGKTEFKKKGIYAFRFEDYDCTVDFVSSPFLARESSFKGKNGTFETLRLDLMDRTTSMYHDADIIIFNTGHWWTHEKTSRGEDYYQEGNYVYPRLKVLEAYKRALITWARWIDENIDRNRTQVFFRGYSVTHFRGGPWNSGGQCDKEMEPIFNKTYLRKYPTKMRALEYVLQEMKTPVLYLNVSRLTDYRKDGHPSIYRMEDMTTKDRTTEIVQDCSHWCLPGVPDTWNELLYASLLKAGKGSWGKLS